MGVRQGRRSSLEQALATVVLTTHCPSLPEAIPSGPDGLGIYGGVVSYK